MQTLEFTVGGKVQPKQSARFTRYGVYQNPKVKMYEKKVQLAFREKYKGDVRFPVNMPLEAWYKIYLPIPQSKSKQWKADAEAGLIRPIIRCDVDNCAKGLSDSLNGLAYYDDKQICKEHIEKLYSENPRVEIKIVGDF